jgi:hypothetical protein
VNVNIEFTTRTPFPLLSCREPLSWNHAADQCSLTLVATSTCLLCRVPHPCGVFVFAARVGCTSFVQPLHASFTCLICSGRVRQHPPTIQAPAANRSRAIAPYLDRSFPSSTGGSVPPLARIWIDHDRLAGTPDSPISDGINAGSVRIHTDRNGLRRLHNSRSALTP